MHEPTRWTPSDDERNYFAGAPATDRPNGLLVPLAVLAVLVAGWTIWSRGEATMVREASASRGTDARETEVDQHTARGTPQDTAPGAHSRP